MTVLALLRHAKAVNDDGGGDHARPLTKAGRDAAAVAGMRLNALLPDDAVVIASDARRTRETAELAFPSQDGSRLRFEPNLYAALPDDILALIRALPDTFTAAVLVGHNPGLSDVASLLAGEGDPADLARVAEGLATADAVVFTFASGWDAVAPKAGRVTAMLSRKDAED